MKRAVVIFLLTFLVAATAARGEQGMLLEINLFQGFRPGTTEGPAPPLVVYMPPAPGWSDDVERERQQIAETLGLEGVSVLAVKRLVGSSGAVQSVTAPWRPAPVRSPGQEEPLTVTIRPVRAGERRVELDLHILRGKTQEIAAASVSGEIGQTFILGGKPGATPIFVAVTPKDISAAPPGVEVYTVGDEIKPPKLVGKIEPRYPEELRQAKKTGLVVIQAMVDTDGSVKRAAVIRHSEPGLDEVALAAVREWRYEPATLRGKPVRVYLTITVSFRLD